MPAEIAVHEEFKEPNWFITVGGFNSYNDFYTFCKTWSVEKHICGWPVWAVMKALNAARRNRTIAGSKQDVLTDVKIQKELTMIAIKKREWIPRDLAVNRMRLTMIATASKIKYAIKLAAPRVCGLFNPIDIENVMTECYNTAIGQLESEAEQLVRWELYGQDQEFDIQQGGEELVTDSETDSREGSGHEIEVATGG